MLKLGMEEGVPIEHGMVTRAIANAQKKVEAHNFEIRKQLLEYDDVMNKQREVIYQHRHAVLAGEDLKADLLDLGRDALIEDLKKLVHDGYERKEQELGSELMRFLEKTFMLQVIDHHWKDHLLGMDHLRDGIGLRGYGQKDPLIEYKKEGYDLFAGMMQRVKSDALERLFRVQAVKHEEREPAPAT